MNEPAPQWDALTEEEVDALLQQYREWMRDLRYWWMKGMMINYVNIQEMIATIRHSHVPL